MKLLRPLLLAIILGLLFGCAGSHEFGPYKGKVVDSETGEPIEGAVVFMRFFTSVPNVGGSTFYDADAVEVLTDRDGEFNIPLRKLTMNKFLHGWEDKGQAIIFKPSYGAFPGHPKVSMNIPGCFIPENKFVLIKLPRLKTVKERKENLGNLFVGINMPPEKHATLASLKEIERAEIGLTP